MEEITVIKESIVNGVKITEYSDGKTVFTQIENSEPIELEESLSWWDKLCNWLRKHEVKPYIKQKDLSDPSGNLKKDLTKHDGSGSMKGTEIGIKISF